MKLTNEPAIANFLTTINQEPQRQKQLPAAVSYQPQTATTDGWKAVQNAWKSQVPTINLLECRWHGRKRINCTLKEYAQQHPDLTPEEFQLLKQQFGHLFAAPSLTAYSQRLRRLSATYGDDPILSKRLVILNGLAVPVHRLPELPPSLSVPSAPRPLYALSG